MSMASSELRMKEDEVAEQVSVGDIVTTPEGYIAKVTGIDDEGYVFVDVPMTYRIDEVSK